MLVPFSFMKTVPVVPVATAATGVGSTSFTANWNAFSGASYYLLDVSLSSSFSTFVLQNTVTTATSYVVTGLTSSTTYYYRVRAAINVDSDVAGFVSRVYAAGGSLSYTEVTATETLVADLKSYGIWTSMKAVYPMVGASAAACAQNLKSSSFTGTFSSGWTFASTGVTGNGTSAFMGTGISASSQLSISSAHMSSYNNTTPTGGVMLSNGDLSCLLQYSASQLYGSLASSYINGVASMTASFIMVNRPSSTTLKIIRNNTIVLSNNSNTGLSYVAANIDMARYGSGFYESSRFAFASIGDGLTDTQASNFYTAVQAFQTTLSRQV